MDQLNFMSLLITENNCFRLQSIKCKLFPNKIGKHFFLANPTGRYEQLQLRVQSF